PELEVGARTDDRPARRTLRDVAALRRTSGNPGRDRRPEVPRAGSVEQEDAVASASADRGQDVAGDAAVPADERRVRSVEEGFVAEHDRLSAGSSRRVGVRSAPVAAADLAVVQGDAAQRRLRSGSDVDPGTSDEPAAPVAAAG